MLILFVSLQLKPTVTLNFDFKYNVNLYKFNKKI